MDKNALDMDVDELTLDFDSINGVRFSIYDTTIKSRDYDGIIKECCTLTEKFSQKCHVLCVMI